MATNEGDTIKNKTRQADEGAATEKTGPVTATASSTPTKKTAVAKKAAAAKTTAKSPANKKAAAKKTTAAKVTSKKAAPILGAVQFTQGAGAFIIKTHKSHPEEITNPEEFNIEPRDDIADPIPEDQRDLWFCLPRGDGNLLR